MSLTELVDGVETHREALRKHDTDAASAEMLGESVEAGTVAGRTAESSAGLDDHATSPDEAFAAAARIPDLLDPPETTGPSVEGPADLAAGPLDQTAFGTFDADELRSAADQIVNRARRVGSGRLHVGFRTLDDLATELDRYESLAAETRLQVDAYAAAEGSVPDHDDALAIHVERADEIRSTRFVAYDGGGRDADKRALVAVEREPAEYRGFGTADPSTVDYVFSHLEAAYPLVPE